MIEFHIWITIMIFCFVFCISCPEHISHVSCFTVSILWLLSLHTAFRTSLKQREQLSIYLPSVINDIWQFVNLLIDDKKVKCSLVMVAPWRPFLAKAPMKHWPMCQFVIGILGPAVGPPMGENWQMWNPVTPSYLFPCEDATFEMSQYCAPPAGL